jgi:hypothetical protein
VKVIPTEDPDFFELTGITTTQEDVERLLEGEDEDSENISPWGHLFQNEADADWISFNEECFVRERAALKTDSDRRALLCRSLVYREVADALGREVAEVPRTIATAIVGHWLNDAPFDPERIRDAFKTHDYDQRTTVIGFKGEMLVADLERGTTSEIRFGGGKDANGKPLGGRHPQGSFSDEEHRSGTSSFLARGFDDD